MGVPLLGCPLKGLLFYWGYEIRGTPILKRMCRASGRVPVFHFHMFMSTIAAYTSLWVHVPKRGKLGP